MLTMGCAVVECDFVIGVDCDRDAIAVARSNSEELELEDRVDFILAKVKISSQPSREHPKPKGGRGGRSRSRKIQAPKAALILDDDDGIPLRDNCVDTVVTNPPFSLYREFLNQLMQHEKKFIIVGPQSAISYKGIFQLLKDGKMWLGTKSGAMKFRVPESRDDDKVIEDEDGNKWQNFGNICWYTNLDVARRHEDLILYQKYNSSDYPKYDNYDAIEVSKVANIPADYDGVMGVPYTFFDKHNPKQFEIIGITKAWFEMASKIYPKQVQVNKDGTKKEVSKLNDCASLKVKTKPKNKTYYEVLGEKFIGTYPRILIKKRVTNEN
jgi:16S rRNA G966 N2-methylase RsmD